MALKIRKGDTVRVISGREVGRTGEVKQVMPSEGRAVVQSVNVRTRHAQPTQQNPDGAYKFDAPIHISNLMLVDPGCKEPTRVGYRFTDSGQKVRVCKKCGKDIDG